MTGHFSSYQDLRASDEDLRLTVVHLVVAFVSKLQETEVLYATPLLDMLQQMYDKLWGRQNRLT